MQLFNRSITKVNNEEIYRDVRDNITIEIGYDINLFL